ncbi:MAG TPA: carboxypeptidase-like regulatory domain-containing protein [Bryobacteraceae bacterium]|nr:carboxypeptidase-like regulatory domain-containing protein [Bryobacteraceae bacterium]
MCHIAQSCRLRPPYRTSNAAIQLHYNYRSEELRDNMVLWGRFILLASIFILLGSIPATIRLQEGSIDGVVSDEWGTVGGASIEARNVLSEVVRRTESDGAGVYKFEELPPGRYSLWIEADKHKSIMLFNVIVQRGEVTHQNVFLPQSRDPLVGRTPDA